MKGFEVVWKFKDYSFIRKSSINVGDNFDNLSNCNLLETFKLQSMSSNKEMWLISCIIYQDFRFWYLRTYLDQINHFEFNVPHGLCLD